MMGKEYKAPEKEAKPNKHFISLLYALAQAGARRAKRKETRPSYA